MRAGVGRAGWSATLAVVVAACSSAPPTIAPASPGIPLTSSAPSGSADPFPTDGPTGYAIPSPPPVDVAEAPASVDVEASTATAAWIGPAGGSLSAVAADGTRYELVFPELAVAEPTAITMAPIGAVEGLALSGGLAGAVWLQPSGLQLAVPARLLIRTAGTAPTDTRLAGFDIARDGAMELLPVGIEDGGIVVPVFHFSGAGGGWGTSTDLQALGAGAQPGRLGSLMTRFLTYDVPWGGVDQGLAFGLLVGVWDALLWPSLQDATTDAQLRAVIADVRQFIFLSNLIATRGDVDAALALGLELGQLPLTYQNLALFHAQARSTLGAKIVTAISGNRTRCARDHDLVALANMWYWAGVGRQIAPGETNWDTAADGCARLVIAVANLPTTLTSGAGDSIRLQFAVDFDDGTRVPADVDATLTADRFTFGTGSETQLSRPVGAEQLLTAGIIATADGPYAVGVGMCLVIAGIPRPFCGQESRQFGAAPTNPPPPTLPPASGPVATLLGCWSGRYVREGGEEVPVPLAGGGPVCVRDGSLIPQLNRPTLALSFSHAYMHGQGPSCLYDLGVDPSGGTFSDIAPFFCGQGVAVDGGYRISGTIGPQGISYSVVWNSPQGEVFKWGSFVLEPPPV